MLKFIIALTLLSAAFFVQSKQLSINVLTQQNMQVGNVVVYLTPKNPQVSPVANKIEIMDQVNTQFLPHILAIQKDTQVRFPNSDSIKHHVYSFSKAKTFELQLYKELQADPLLFSNIGAVELGCNIHDWMLGYIFVVDTPYFGQTDSHGKVTLEVPEGEYQLDVWHPRIQDKLSALSRQVISPTESDIQVILASPLLPDVNQYEEISGEFSDYE
ncbi:methylamine utilization protein [uncultured Paraglaciecola sp.]|uniref:methylamine utilization protein n=1 Tax=uncultured Paraglaciecola sp. TaxID=1765024 RepID=UPI0030DB0351|tara:strand:+ start:1319 stop:1963 length:645 start_codon:yes stop_codon:yes gene_type:complete